MRNKKLYKPQLISFTAIWKYIMKRSWKLWSIYDTLYQMCNTSMSNHTHMDKSHQRIAKILEQRNTSTNSYEDNNHTKLPQATPQIYGTKKSPIFFQLFFSYMLILNPSNLFFQWWWAFVSCSLIPQSFPARTTDFCRVSIAFCAVSIVREQGYIIRMEVGSPGHETVAIVLVH